MPSSAPATGDSASTRAPDQPRQGAVPAARQAPQAADQARAHPAPRHRRPPSCCPTSPSGRSTCTATRTGSTSRASGTRQSRPTPPTGCVAGTTPTPIAARPRSTSSWTAAALAWVANYGAVELHPWTSTMPDSQRPTWALIDIDPGDRTTFDDVLVLARLHRTALEHLGVQAGPKVTGQRGCRSGSPSPTATRSPTPARGSSSSREGSAPRCPTWSAGSGR